MSEEARNLNISDDSVVAEDSDRILAFLLEPSDAEKASLKDAGKPTTLWLMMRQRREYPPGYRHAWGTSWVSTQRNGPANNPVQSLRMRIVMPKPGGGNVTDDKRSGNSAEVKADCKYGGIVAGNFRSDCLAEATDNASLQRTRP